MYHLALRQPCKCALQRTFQHSCRQFSIRNPPPNFRQAGFGKVLLLVTPLAAAGGAITYAKYDNNFRKYLEQNVPGAESILKVALQEENPFQGISTQIDKVSKTIEDTTATITGFFGGGGSSADKSKNAPQAAEEPVAKTPAATKTLQTKSTVVPVSAPAKSSSKSSEPVKIVKKSESLPSDVVELEKAVEVASALAIKEYNKAIDLLKKFNDDVRRVVDQAIENGDTQVWVQLKNRSSARDSSVSTAENLAREALDKIEKCGIALSKVVSVENNEQVNNVRDKIKKATEHINHIKDELYRNKDAANVSEKYWRNVERARNYFVDEIESIFPGLNISNQQLNLSKDDLDLFIMHAYSHVLAYQKELQRLQTDGELRLKRAIDAFRGENDSDAVKAQLEYHLEAEKRKMIIENQKKIFQIRAEAEKTLRQQLRQQAEAHQDHLKDAVALKEAEVKRSYSRELEDKLAAEKANYKLQLAAMLGKMRGMDAALQARAESERSAHQAQALWAACQALWATVRTGDPSAHWRTKLRPLKSEIKAINKVSEGDELVSVILQNLPREAEDRGVFPEDALRERFLNVERVARKVALVPEEGASLPVYALSYLQSLFIMRPDEPISQAELQDQKFDYSKLDTYDILNRARYFVDRGDLMQALKYMNLLQGASRHVSSDWIRETRLLLETQQAANLLMTHAAASGLLYL